MRRLLAFTCLTPLFVNATALRSETLVDTKRTSPITTATAKNGGRDDLRITGTGSLELTSGTAVTLDSANSVRNEGTIVFKDASDVTGILGSTAGTGDISNTGKISIEETYAASDADKNGDLDGPFSKQARNSGIKTTGAFVGNLTNGGAVVVKGNQSAGITLGGPLTGNLTHSGTIDIVGDGSVGIRTGAMSGALKILGAITAQGAGAVALDVAGPVGGPLLIQSSIGASGYRTTSLPSDVSKLDAEDLLQGGPAVRVAGSVAGGILFDIRPKDNDPKIADEDKDGVEDAKEGSASILSYGAAPAVVIGAASGNLAIGALSGNAQGFGLVVNGDLLGSGVYKGVEGVGLQIGGTGSAVTIAGGAAVNGNVSAKSLDASATSIRVGAGANLTRLQVGGSVNASSGVGATGEVRAISVESGATLGSVTNGGIIAAASTGDGAATAIRDRSGTLAIIENTGSITAVSKKTSAESAVAIDVQTSSLGVTVRQNQVAAATVAPKIIGAVLFGSGSDVLEVADGSLSGTIRFGSGNNRLILSGDGVVAGDVTFGAAADTLTLAGTSSLSGTLDFGGGADTFTLGGTSRFTGRVTNGAGVAVGLTGGTLDLRNTGAVALSSLTLSGTSTLGVTIDPATKSATQYQVASAFFGQGTKVAVSVASVGSAEGDYIIVKAGSLTGGANLAADSASLPFMFKGTVAANDAAGQVTLKVQRKPVADLGLNRSEAAAFDAVFKALDKDAKVAGAFLAIRQQEDFQGAVQQMLPDHAGGVFETVTRGSRTMGGYISDPNAMVADLGGGVGFWLQQAVWGTSKSRGDTASFRTSGWGASGGFEVASDAGKFGASLAYLNGKSKQRRVDAQVDADQYEATLHWRNSWGGLNAYARGSAALVKLSGSRSFGGSFGNEKVSRVATGDWDGALYSAAGGISYQVQTGRLTFRPGLNLDYFRLKEDGHSEGGGGDAFNLTVGARTSDEFAATGTVAAGYDLSRSDTGLFRIELEGGRRELLGGSLGKTVASFKGGASFTLLPEERDTGWLGKLRLVGGGEGFRASGEASVEEQNGRAAVGVRATLSVGL